MNDHTQTPQASPAPLRKPFAPPSLERLGALASVTRGPGMTGTQDAVIFQMGGDPSDDPS
ncbi:MAG: hypothetical protein ABJF88_10895 [Rhodothermales bacterium]